MSRTKSRDCENISCGDLDSLAEAEPHRRYDLRIGSSCANPRLFPEENCTFARLVGTPYAIRGTIYPQARLLFETYDGSTKDRRILSLDEALQFAFKEADCCLARPLGIEGYKDRHGKWRSLSNGKALGCHGEEILKAVMRHAGLQLGKVVLSEITSLDNLVDDGILPARVYYLRRLFGERKGSERFIRTFSHNKTMTVMWPRELTWVIVEPTFEK